MSFFQKVVAIIMIVNFTLQGTEGEAYARDRAEHSGKHPSPLLPQSSVQKGGVATAEHEVQSQLFNMLQTNNQPAQSH